MSQQPLLEFEDCFGVEAGTPTLTVVLEDHQRMVPYHSLAGGKLQANTIELRFQDWLVSIGGNHLDPLWRAFQLQDVRWVRAIASSDAEEMDGECAVTSIDVSAVEA